jgi:hypothetical protein
MAEPMGDFRLDVASLAAHWPRFVRLANQNPDVLVDGRRAYLFAEIFPTVDKETLAQLSTAFGLFETVIYEIDSVLDNDRSAALNLMDLTAIQFEAYRIFADIFAGRPVVWEEARKALAAYMEMVGEQREFGAGRLDLLGLSYTDAVRMAHAKTSLAMVAVTALGELAGQSDLAARAAQSVDRLMVAKCFMDDILDWRRDAELGQPSYVLALAGTAAGVGARPAGGWSLSQLDRIGHSVYFDGSARQVVDAVFSLIGESRRLVADLAGDSWRARIDQAEQLVRGFAANLPGPLEAHETRGHGTRHTVRLRVEQARPWHAVARTSLIWLLQQWRLSFPDAVPVNRLTSTAACRPETGNVLERAIIANTIAACDGALADGQLRAFIQRDVDFVISRCGEPLSSWAASPDRGLPPCEVDEIAEIVRLYSHAGPDHGADRYLKPAALVAASADPDLLANFLTAVPSAGGDLADDGIQRIIQAQEAAGSWPSRLYQGPLYATFRCMAAVTEFRPDIVEPVRRAGDFILDRQNADGGWANDASIDSDALGTAVALLALAEWDRAAQEPAPRVRAAVDLALAWLSAHAEKDGSYPAVPFLKLSPDDNGGIVSATGHGTRSVTTALVCRAALAWDELR